MIEPPVQESIPDIGRFVVGRPRAGTTAMIRALSQDPQVAAFGETLFWGRFWVEPDSQGRLDRSSIDRIANEFLTLKLDPAGDDGLWESRTTPIPALAESLRSAPDASTPAEVFRELTSQVLNLTGRRYWVEKTPHHMMHLDRILHWMPGSRFVVMLRDPVSFLQSYKQQGDRKPPEIRRQFHRLYHPAAASMVARRTFEAAHRVAQRDEVLIVPIEQLQSAPEEWMSRVRRHLRLPEFRDTQFARDNSSFADGQIAMRPLTSAEKAWLRRLVASPAASLGFNLRDTLPSAPIAWLLSVATLPWWAIRNARAISRLDRGGIRSLLRRWVARHP
jgi:hypothetical protein